VIKTYRPWAKRRATALHTEPMSLSGDGIVNYLRNKLRKWLGISEVQLHCTHAHMDIGQLRHDFELLRNQLEKRRVIPHEKDS
jgi:SMC interacting uncharacterized protein involved in chromosome segregation